MVFSAYWEDKAALSDGSYNLHMLTTTTKPKRVWVLMSTELGGRGKSRTGYIEKRAGREHTCKERLNKSLLRVTHSCHCHQMFCIWHSESIGPHLWTSLSWWQKLEKQQTLPAQECSCAGKSHHGTGLTSLNWILVIEGNWLKKSISKACYCSMSEPVRTGKALKLVPTLQHLYS